MDLDTYVCVCVNVFFSFCKLLFSQWQQLGKTEKFIKFNNKMTGKDNVYAHKHTHTKHKLQNIQRSIGY